jgi:type III pantothenate kinase
MPSPRRVVASSVRPDRLEALTAAASSRLGEKVLVIGRDVPLPMLTDLPAPQRIGTDRLCTAAMAYHRLRSACVVADFGSAVTIDAVSDDGVFLGGAILPGLRMSAAALAGRTAALPEVRLARPQWVFGTDTEKAIIGGIVLGARGALREIAEAYATAMGKWPPVILTGGDAELIGTPEELAAAERHAGEPFEARGRMGLDLVHAIVPDLCLMGIALAWRLGQAEQP